MKYKYKTFNDYFEELESFSHRLARFHEEFDQVPLERRKRMIEWLEAAFECGRMYDEDNR